MPLKVYVAFYPVLFGGRTLYTLYSAMAYMSLSYSPSAKALAISVPYRDNGIEVVNIGIIVFAIGGSCFHFGNNHFYGSVKSFHEYLGNFFLANSIFPIRCSLFLNCRFFEKTMSYLGKNRCFWSFDRIKSIFCTYSQP